MSLARAPSKTVAPAEMQVPPLENGDHLSAQEFMRRYEATPEIKKAELIEGVVYMGSPVRLLHAAPDTIIQCSLGFYAAHTPGTQAAGNPTVRFSSKNVPQPDALVRLLPEYGGRTTVDEKGYLCGPPELIVEIAASSAAIDLHQKLRVYRRAGVLEYLIWRTVDNQFDWFVLEGDDYRPNPPDVQGQIRSRCFPGLTVAVGALLAQDSAKVLEALQRELQKPAHRAFVARLAARKSRRS